MRMSCVYGVRKVNYELYGFEINYDENKLGLPDDLLAMWCVRKG